MNCKPGDLARVISCPESRLAGLDDVFIKVTHLDGVSDNGTNPVWAYEGPMLRHRSGPTVGRLVEAFADCILRPIRPQSDDATDETLTWLDVPTKQGETA